MILQSLRLHNFGLYRGSHTFDLTPDSASEKPVILVVGHNGSGKTTFLEAVQLALYGKRALGPRVGQAEYEGHLLRRINNTAPERRAFVELSFKSQHLGTNDTYVVRREWASRGTSVVEALQFDRNGYPVDDIPREDWNHYLEDIIPAGVSQLFFFDGEKIQDIADDQDNAGLSDAIKSLLGIDIIDQLRGDLALYKSRNTDRRDAPDLEAIRRDIEVARTDLVISEERIGSFSSKRAQLARRSEAAQRLFEQEGGPAALSRDSLSDELKAVESEFSKQAAALKNLVNGAAPFALAPKLVARFSAEVQGTVKSKTGRAVDRFVSDFEAAMVEKPGGAWRAEHFEALKEFSDHARDTSEAITLSADPDWILGKLHAIADERIKAAGLSARLSELRARRATLRDQFKNFRPGAASSAFEELKQAEFELGGLETELNRERSEAAQLRALVERLDRELSKAQDAVFDVAKSEVQKDLATRTQNALIDYEKRIVEKRLASLTQHFIDAFNGLVTRKKLVRTVSIDPETFRITLSRSDGEEVVPSELSAGERQLFAISMLWALGRTSGREMPMIIDTPLSRLDQHHRNRLMSDYIPRTGVQVVMLCTDTELTPDLSSIIAPHVNRRYEIGVIDDGLQTSISEATDAIEVEHSHAY